MILDKLAAAERAYQRATKRAEAAREERNRLIREALAERHTHSEIAQTTGLTRGRVNQLSKG